MYGEQGFKAVHKTEHLVKFIGKGYSFFFLEPLNYIKLLSTTGYKVLYGTYIPGRTTTEQSYTISGL